ncbi:MAG: GtrA family protein [Candidatus Saccharimonadales bacterium]
MTQENQKEFGKFFLVGVVSTVFDYLLLNFFAVILGIPLLVSNSISAPFSSYVSYKLNKKLVFEDRMHGQRKTLILYAAIVAFGILVIQNSLLHVLQGSVALTLAETINPILGGSLSTETLAINIAKVCASLIAALWNFFMLRRFVFVTKDDLKS